MRYQNVQTGEIVRAEQYRPLSIIEDPFIYDLIRDNRLTTTDHGGVLFDGQSIPVSHYLVMDSSGNYQIMSDDDFNEIHKEIG